MSLFSRVKNYFIVGASSIALALLSSCSPKVSLDFLVDGPIEQQTAITNLKEINLNDTFYLQESHLPDQVRTEIENRLERILGHVPNFAKSFKVYTSVEAPNDINEQYLEYRKHLIHFLNSMDELNFFHIDPNKVEYQFSSKEVIDAIKNTPNPIPGFVGLSYNILYMVQYDDGSGSLKDIFSTPINHTGGRAEYIKYAFLQDDKIFSIDYPIVIITSGYLNTILVAPLSEELIIPCEIFLEAYTDNRVEQLIFENPNGVAPENWRQLEFEIAQYMEGLTEAISHYVVQKGVIENSNNYESPIDLSEFSMYNDLIRRANMDPIYILAPAIYESLLEDAHSTLQRALDSPLEFYDEMYQRSLEILEQNSAIPLNEAGPLAQNLFKIVYQPTPLISVELRKDGSFAYQFAENL